MSRKISFTKAEQRALLGILGGSANPDMKALQSLYDKMEAASAPLDRGLRVTPQAFAETLQEVMGPRVVVVDHPSTWIKLYSVLKLDPFENLDAVRELGESVLTWARNPVSIHTLAVKGPEWLAMHRARAEVKEPAPVRKLMWDEDPE